MEQIKFESLANILEKEENIALLQGKNLEETLEILANLGVSVTAEELHEFYNFVTEEDAELNEDALAQVAGGVNWKRYWGGLKSTFKGMWDGFWRL